MSRRSEEAHAAIEALDFWLSHFLPTNWKRPDRLFGIVPPAQIPRFSIARLRAGFAELNRPDSPFYAWWMRVGTFEATQRLHRPYQTNDPERVTIIVKRLPRETIKALWEERPELWVSPEEYQAWRESWWRDPELANQRALGDIYRAAEIGVHNYTVWWAGPIQTLELNYALLSRGEALARVQGSQAGYGEAESRFLSGFLSSYMANNREELRANAKLFDALRALFYYPLLLEFESTQEFDQRQMRRLIKRFRKLARRHRQAELPKTIADYGEPSSVVELVTVEGDQRAISMAFMLAKDPQSECERRATFEFLWHLGNSRFDLAKGVIALAAQHLQLSYVRKIVETLWPPGPRAEAVQFVAYYEPACSAVRALYLQAQNWEGGLLFGQTRHPSYIPRGQLAKRCSETLAILGTYSRIEEFDGILGDVRRDPKTRAYLASGGEFPLLPYWRRELPSDAPLVGLGSGSRASETAALRRWWRDEVVAALKVGFHDALWYFQVLGRWAEALCAAELEQQIAKDVEVGAEASLAALRQKAIASPLQLSPAVRWQLESAETQRLARQVAAQFARLDLIVEPEREAVEEERGRVTRRGQPTLRLRSRSPKRISK